MKKFYSLIAALLLAGSIMAGELVFTAADFSGKGAASPGAAMEVTKQGVTVAVDLGLGSGTDIRVFAGSTLTVTADVNILKITPEFAPNNKMEFDPVQPNATSWSINATKQIRLSKLTVEVDKEVTPEADPVNLGPKTIAEFIALANTKDTCVITGKVSGVTSTTASFANFYLNDGNDKVKIYGLKDAEGNLANFSEFGIANGDSLTVKAVYTLYQGEPEAAYPHFVSLKKAPLEPADTVSIEITTGVVLLDEVQSGNWWQIIAQNDKYSVYICSDETATAVAGTYTMANLDPDYTGLDIYSGTDTTSVSFVSGSIVVTQDATTGSVEAVGSFFGDDDVLYNIRLLFVQPKADTTVQVTIADAELDDTYLDYGVFAVAGCDAENTACVQLAMWMPEEAESITGHYTESDLDYSIFGTFIDDGKEQEIYTASIDVIANKDGSYTVNANVLCYNNTLYQIQMTVPVAQGIDNTAAGSNASKRLKKGILEIEKNGVRYSTLGQKIR